ncbi:MAG: alpha/beta fold hydrolase [Chloroflexi bacterium]|nr:alpha/beta fold hydrolase [Chloroflexota bacterium]
MPASKESLSCGPEWWLSLLVLACRLRWRWAAFAAIALLVASCGGATSVVPTATERTVSPSLTSTPTANPLASPTLEGRFAVDDSGRELAIECWGTGDPTVFLESGGGAIDEFSGSALVRELASERRVCLYNRAGRPPSDPAPDEPREAEDIAAYFHALTRAAEISPPFFLFGRSYGGMLVTFYASEYPDDVAGVVVFDSPAPSATMTEEDFPEGVWDFPGNTERTNVLTGFENRFGRDPVHFEAPLILISPTHGESTPDDRYWLQTSSDAEQVVLEGGMEVIDTQASVIADYILAAHEP